VTAGYKGLEVYQLALRLAVDIHTMTLTLPKIETYEEGSQIRRSSKSIVANIVEGYGRRQYKNEFIRHLVYACASCDETMAHLEMLYQTGSLDRDGYTPFYEQCLELGKKLYRFKQSVMSRHNQFPIESEGARQTTPTNQRILEESAEYLDMSISDPACSTSDPES